MISDEFGTLPAAPRIGAGALSPLPPKPAGRVLVVSPEPFFEERGTPIVVQMVVKALCEQGREVDLLTYPVGAPVKIPGLRIIRVGERFGIKHVPIGLSWKKIFLDLLLSVKLHLLLRSRRYSHVHALEESIFPVLLACRWHKVPAIYDMQSSLPEQMAKFSLFRPAAVQRFLRVFESWAIRNSDYIVSSSGMSAHIRSVDPGARIREWNFPGAPLDVSIDEIHALRHNLGLSPADKVVVYTGNGEPYQGVPLLLDASPAILGAVPGAVVLIVGIKNTDVLRLSPETAALVRAGRVKILPRQARAAIPAFLAIADVLVSPRSYGSNIGFKVFEYMFSGKAIVATDSPTHRSVLNEERARLVPSVPSELARAVVNLLNDPEEAGRLAGTAKAYAHANLGWTSFARDVNQIYDRSQGRRSSRRIASPSAPPEAVAGRAGS